MSFMSENDPKYHELLDRINESSLSDETKKKARRILFILIREVAPVSKWRLLFNFNEDTVVFHGDDYYITMSHVEDKAYRV